jgi:hypothetical protein
MPVATAEYARVKPPISHWASIASVTVFKNGIELGGHAILFYQPEPGGDVFAYDTSGTAHLQTQSHDLGALVQEYNRRAEAMNEPYRLQALQWVVGSEATPTPPAVATKDDKAEDGDRGLIHSTKAERDAADAAEATKLASPAPMSPEMKKVTETISIIIVAVIGLILVGLYIWAVVVCFQKGKPIFATLGIVALFTRGAMSLWVIIGACRLAKPHSWWAWRYYGAEKLQRALDRHAKLYGEPTTARINQRIQELKQKATVATPPAPTPLSTRDAMRERLATAPVIATSDYTGAVIDVA